MVKPTATTHWFNPSRLKTRHLLLLMHLEEQGSVLRAAEAARMTQPAASKLLAEMEGLLGVPLFERHARGVEPDLVWTGTDPPGADRIAGDRPRPGGDRRAEGRSHGPGLDRHRGQSGDQPGPAGGRGGQARASGHPRTDRNGLQPAAGGQAARRPARPGDRADHGSGGQRGPGVRTVGRRAALGDRPQRPSARRRRCGSPRGAGPVRLDPAAAGQRAARAHGDDVPRAWPWSARAIPSRPPRCR